MSIHTPLAKASLMDKQNVNEATVYAYPQEKLQVTWQLDLHRNEGQSNTWQQYFNLWIQRERSEHVTIKKVQGLVLDGINMIIYLFVICCYIIYIFLKSCELFYN